MNLQRIVKKWQKILRLQDWDIEIEYGRLRELEDDLAIVIPGLRSKVATIKVLDPLDWEKKHDVEAYIVHELIHLYFEPFWEDRKEEEMEQAICGLTKALITLDRKTH